jgi:hypothetical protein
MKSRKIPFKWQICDVEEAQVLSLKLLLIMEIFTTVSSSHFYYNISDIYSHWKIFYTILRQRAKNSSYLVQDM